MEKRRQKRVELGVEHVKTGGRGKVKMVKMAAHCILTIAGVEIRTAKRRRKEMKRKEQYEY